MLKNKTTNVVVDDVAEPRPLTPDLEYLKTLKPSSWQESGEEAGDVDSPDDASSSYSLEFTPNGPFPRDSRRTPGEILKEGMKAIHRKRQQRADRRTRGRFQIRESRQCFTEGLAL
ncbi:hypothetical protein FCV25MIE_28921 [Fagus crenata]